jgi:hypothetical protein
MQEAISAKHNTELDGRKISVKEAIPQDQVGFRLCCCWFEAVVRV